MAKQKSSSDTLQEVKVIGRSLRQKVGNDIKNLPTLKAPAAAPGKKLGRVATALSDATSDVRGAANLAFGKNKSQTTGGKILERAARVGAVGLGVGTAKKAMVAGKMLGGAVKKGITTAAKAGTVNPIGKAIVTAGTVAAGQAMYKDRSAESTRRGLLNPGKGNANLGINFDKPFQKTKGRDVPLPDSSSLFNK
jgi:hypothetical protein